MKLYGIGGVCNDVLGDIARGCSKTVRCDADTINIGQREEEEADVDVLDDPSCSRRDRAKGVYMRHNVVAAFLLFHGSDLELFRGKVLCMR